MKRAFSHKQDALIAAQYMGRGSIGHLAALYSVSRQAVTGALLRVGIKIQRTKLSPIQKTEIVTRYRAGENSRRLAKAFGVTHPTITKILKDAKEPIRTTSQAARRHSINEVAFDRITPESAYWIGFLMADGSVSGNRLEVPQSKADRHHLVRLRRFLGSSHPIYERPSASLIHPRTGKVYWCKPMCVLSLCCKPLTAALRRYGLHSEKSYGAEIIGLEMNRDFWRGVIDGDGTVQICKRRRTGPPYPCISLIGSRSLLKQFSAFVRQHVPQTRAFVGTGGGVLSKVAINSAFAICLARILYEGAAVALSRKAKTARRILRQFG